MKKQLRCSDYKNLSNFRFKNSTWWRRLQFLIQEKEVVNNREKDEVEKNGKRSVWGGVHATVPSPFNMSLLKELTDQSTDPYQPRRTSWPLLAKGSISVEGDWQTGLWRSGEINMAYYERTNEISKIWMIFQKSAWIRLGEASQGSTLQCVWRSITIQRWSKFMKIITKLRSVVMDAFDVLFCSQRWHASFRARKRYRVQSTLEVCDCDEAALHYTNAGKGRARRSA